MQDLETLTQQLEQQLTTARNELSEFDKSLGQAILSGVTVDQVAAKRGELLTRKQALTAALETASDAAAKASDAQAYARRKQALNTLHELGKKSTAVLTQHEKTVQALRATLASLETLQHESIQAANAANVGMVPSVTMPLASEIYLLKTYLAGHDANGAWLKSKTTNYDIRNLL